MMMACSSPHVGVHPTVSHVQACRPATDAGTMPAFNLCVAMLAADAQQKDTTILRTYKDNSPPHSMSS